MELTLRLIVGLALSLIIAVFAYWRRSLSASGVLGAVIVGTTIYSFGGLPWWALLITFFVSSSALSSFKKGRKRAVAAEKFEKGSRRDIWQALANGGLGAVIAATNAFAESPFFFGAYLGVMATVNADTWATELGVLSSRPPRLVSTFQVVEPGTSGGVSVVGTLATTGGAFLIGAAAVLFVFVDGVLGGQGFGDIGGSLAQGVAALVLAGTVGGLVGSLTDSLLGATVQAMYFSPQRGKETERVIDPDGSPNRFLRGIRWMNNDVVNVTASAVGGAVGAFVFLLFL